MKAAIIAGLVLSATCMLHAAEPYQGFGAATAGGAGRAVYHVTRLADSGSGTLRDAVSKGSRTVVFDVAGEIFLSSDIKVKGVFLTIDGHTAPPPGITLRRYGLYINGEGGKWHDLIVRGIRIREPNGDGITLKNGVYNVVVDHVSIADCGDGNIDVTKNAHDVTVSWSVFADCAKNMLIKYSARRITLHHNVFVDSRWRNPWISNEDDGTPSPYTTVDMRNNLVWAWDTGAGTGVECGAKANLVANFYSSPRSGLKDQKEAIIVYGSKSGCPAQAYTNGNVSGDPIGISLDSYGNVKAPFAAPPVNTHDAVTAAHDALAGAGVSPQDAVDQRHLSGIRLPARP